MELGIVWILDVQIKGNLHIFKIFQANEDCVKKIKWSPPFLMTEYGVTDLLQEFHVVAILRDSALKVEYLVPLSPFENYSVHQTMFL